MSFNPGYKMEFTEEEAKEARAIRDKILYQLSDCMQQGVAADAEVVYQLIAAYREQFIDRYLYKSTLITLYGLSTVYGTDPMQVETFARYGEGFGLYFAQCLRCYCEREEKQRS